MKRLLILILVVICQSFVLVQGKESKEKQDKKDPRYSFNVTIKDIPEGQQTLFVPIKIDTMVLDFDKVALEDLSAQNILAVASSSMDKVGTGIGLLKLDEKGLPKELTLKVLLKSVGAGQTDISVLKVAEEPALPSKGALLYQDVIVTIESKPEIEISEKVEGGKKRLALSESKLALSIKRPQTKEETIFIPIIFDNNVIDLDETFGHAIVAPGIAAKSFSSGSLHEGGPGVEIRLSEAAEKDFTINVDLIPKKTGVSKLSCAVPQIGHTAIVRGPTVNINPQVLSVANVVEGN